MNRPLGPFWVSKKLNNPLSSVKHSADSVELAKVIYATVKNPGGDFPPEVIAVHLIETDHVLVGTISPNDILEH